MEQSSILKFDCPDLPANIFNFNLALHMIVKLALMDSLR